MCRYLRGATHRHPLLPGRARRARRPHDPRRHPGRPGRAHPRCPVLPDGAGLYDGGPIGIPFTTVPGTQAKVPITFDDADESDPGPYPIPANAPIEGGPSSGGDRHVLVVDRDRCTLYEVYAADPQSGGARWTAGSGAVWDLRSNALRTAGATSADAAGLAILPGLVRYDEIAAGVIDHAIRITLDGTDNRSVWPATHRAGVNDPNRAPMGQRFRLKASVDIASYPPQSRIVLRALQQYGAIVADSGSSWYISGAPDDQFDNDDLHSLGGLRGSDFEAVNARAPRRLRPRPRRHRRRSVRTVTVGRASGRA